MTSTATDSAVDVLTCGDLDIDHAHALMARFGLTLVRVTTDSIPGSYWGAPEAGLLEHRVYVRDDTPVHSFLHEACHAICMDAGRRATLDTDAGGDDLEENGVCYLQIVLADHLPGVGRDRLMIDMDRWGYSFRLGSTRAWFDQDADDARAWLHQYDLIDEADRPTFHARSV